MSAINNALAELAAKKSSATKNITRAEVKPIKQRSVLPWIVGSFGLSLAVGGWAVSQQASMVTQVESFPEPFVVVEGGNIASPTAKMVAEEPPIYQPQQRDTIVETTVQPKAHVIAETANSAIVAKSPATKTNAIHVANVDVPAKSHSVIPASSGEVVIEQVELTSEQLSQKAQERAKKALDSNNLAEALKNYNEALRYTPLNSDVRRRLSALYYGKGEVRKAADILQKGIALDSDNATLRLSLAKMLMKEKQEGAALTVLSALPESASVDYLSLRAALAQKAKQDDIALESYQKLVEREPESGRWWLGLGIQQERAFDLTAAKSAYQQAITKLGLSSKTQQFIHDRLTLISRLEEQPSEN